MNYKLNLSNSVKKTLLILILGLMFLTPIVHAFGVSTPYFANDTVPLEINQEFTYQVNIQNSEDINFDLKFEYTADSDVAILRERDLYIPAKSYDNYFIFDIHLPNTSLPGDVYTLEFTAQPIIENEGQVPMNVQIKRHVDFVTVEEGGVGISTIKLNWFQKIVFGIQGIFERIYLYLLGALIIIAIVLMGNRLWVSAKQIASKIFSSKRKSKDRRKSFDYTHMLSNAKTYSDLSALVRMIPSEAFSSIKLRQKLSKKLSMLGNKKLSTKVMFAKSKAEILKLLRK